VNGRVLNFALERGSANRDQARALVEAASEIETKYPGVKLVYTWLE